MLKEKDYRQMKELVEITKLIWVDCCELGKLETEGEKDTPKYHDILRDWDIYQTVEPALYQKIKGEDQKIEDMINYFRNCSSCADEILLEKLLSSSDLTVERVIRNLSNLLPVDYEAGNNIIENEFLSIIPKTPGTVEMRKSFLQDLFACFLSIVNKNKWFYQFGEPFTMMKYRLAFLMEDMEEYLIQNHFEIPNQVYLNSHCVGQLNGQDDHSIAQFKSITSTQIVLDETAFLLAQDDEEFSKHNLEMNLRLCILRAALLFLSDDEVVQLNERFHMTIENPKYRKAHSNNRTAQEGIGFAYRMHQEDQSIPISVQFRR